MTTSIMRWSMYPGRGRLARKRPLLAHDATTSWIKVQLADGTSGWVGSGYLLSTYPKISLPIAAE